ncbi:MAG: KAP family NTPase [Bacillus sp. (in: Bacteria)]|nr:KAP family NTPase [Bacillus sp. (in: firmicutes)]MCM1426498.1 KAP family NTPase [Eubacterium sp.]
MTETELNNYIRHYLEEDKTHTAIMLTGEWGSGKTYYIENVLVPFLQDKKNRCIVVSLYGLENISDISKSIYMELKMKTLEKNSEVKATGKLVAKTVVKGVAGKLGIDVSMSEDDLQNLYSSVDLSGKLLIFEDLERSNIELIKVLGYINNLVERDGVKILLVANENEILNKTAETFNFNFVALVNTSASNNNKENNKKSIPENIQKYLRIKEKTISDTIFFESNYCEAVKNIVKTFGNEKITKILDEDNDIVKELVSMVRGICHKNFRTFIFATQKTVDIFNQIEENYDKDFLKCIYFGMISFSAKIKEGEFPIWQGTEYISVILGTSQYPLFRFCYDYIRWQKINIDKISNTRDEYEEMKLYDKRADRNDKDLQILYNYNRRTEKEVREVLKNIERRLNNPKDIGFYNYGKLAAYLVKMNHILEFDYANCKELMTKNISGKGDNISSNLLFLPMYDVEEEEKTELENFIRQMSESMNIRDSRNDFSYNPDEIENLYNRVIEEKQEWKENHKFLSEYNANQIVEMLFHASAKQIDDFRDMLFAVYRYAEKADFVEEDVIMMEEILELVQEKINSYDYGIDKIQEQQLKWLCNNLETFIARMT